MNNNLPKISDQGLMLVVSYFTLLVVNSLVLMIANFLFPGFVVLGTRSLSTFWAILLSMGVLALINTFAIPFVHLYEEQRKKIFTTSEWMISYFALNFVGIWFVTRAANQLGMGITSWVVALVLALVFDFVQGMAMMQLEKMKASSK